MIDHAAIRAKLRAQGVEILWAGERYAVRAENRLVGSIPGTRDALRLFLESLSPAISGRRKAMLAALERDWPAAQAAAKRRMSGQLDLFGDGGDDDVPAFGGLDPEIGDDTFENLEWEHELLGVYCTGHPFFPWRSWWSRECVPTSEVSGTGRHEGDVVMIGGRVDTLDVRTSKRGNRWAKLRLSDFTGDVEVVMFAETLRSVDEHLKVGMSLAVEGKLQARRLFSKFESEDESDSFPVDPVFDVLATSATPLRFA